MATATLLAQNARFTALALIVIATPVCGQSLSDAVDGVSASATVFAGATHTRQETIGGTNSNTRPSAGVDGQVAADLSRGSNALALRYQGRLETSRSLPDGDQIETSSVSGAARYDYRSPAGRLDANLGHAVQSVRNNTGFALNTGDYDTRHTVSAGAGLRFYPGEVTTWRLAVQGGRSFADNDLDDNDSWRATSSLNRRLSERSLASLNAERSWADDGGLEITIDSAELGYQRDLETGDVSLAIGASQSEADFPGQSATLESDAITGRLARTWLTPQTDTLLRYQRRLSDSATDLSLDVPPELAFLPESIQLRDLVTSDSLLLSQRADALCQACRLSWLAEGTRLDSEIEDRTTYEYRAVVGLSVDLDRRHQVQTRYQWQGDTGEQADQLEAQSHRLSASVTRQLLENTWIGVELNQVWLRPEADNRDQSQYAVRLFLTRRLERLAKR